MLEENPKESTVENANDANVVEYHADSTAVQPQLRVPSPEQV